ncbi:MAG: hypothetical protein WKG06_07975 [Segetibacter sp.]
MYTIPVTIVTIVGFGFCLLPGIYLAVVFVPFSIAIIVEDQTFGGAWNRCFNLIKNNFWTSLGIYFIVYLVYGLSVQVLFQALLAMITGLISYFTTRDTKHNHWHCYLCFKHFFFCFLHHFLCFRLSSLF